MPVPSGLGGAGQRGTAQRRQLARRLNLVLGATALAFAFRMRAKGLTLP